MDDDFSSGHTSGVTKIVTVREHLLYFSQNNAKMLPFGNIPLKNS